MKNFILWGMLILFLIGCGESQEWIPVHQFDKTVNIEKTSTEYMKVDSDGTVYIDINLVNDLNVGKTYKLETGSKTVSVTITKEMVTQNNTKV